MTRKKTPADKPHSVEQAGDKIAQGTSHLLAANDSGRATVRLNLTKKVKETYPLKLTKQQRESMIHSTRIKHMLKVRLKKTGEGMQVVGFNRKELDHLNLELGRAALYAPSPEKKRLVAVLHRVANLLPEGLTGSLKETKPNTRKNAPKKGDLINQFKITLLDIKPAI
jgi:hypothetical protein